MKLILLLFLAIVLFGSCRKDGPDDIISFPPEPVTYPYSDRFAGVINISHHIAELYTPSLDYDTSYPVTFAVVRPDSSRIEFELFFWDYKIIAVSNPQIYVRYYFNLKKSFSTTPNQGYVTDSSRHHETSFVLSKDSLLIYKGDNWGNSYDQNTLTAYFKGKKI